MRIVSCKNNVKGNKKLEIGDKVKILEIYSGWCRTVVAEITAIYDKKLYYMAYYKEKNQKITFTDNELMKRKVVKVNEVKNMDNNEIYENALSIQRRYKDKLLETDIKNLKSWMKTEEIPYSIQEIINNLIYEVQRLKKEN